MDENHIYSEFQPSAGECAAALMRDQLANEIAARGKTRRQDYLRLKTIHAYALLSRRSCDPVLTDLTAFCDGLLGASVIIAGGAGRTLTTGISGRAVAGLDTQLFTSLLLFLLAAALANAPDRRARAEITLGERRLLIKVKAALNAAPQKAGLEMQAAAHAALLLGSQIQTLHSDDFTLQAAGIPYAPAAAAIAALPAWRYLSDPFSDVRVLLSGLQ